MNQWTDVITEYIDNSSTERTDVTRYKESRRLRYFYLATSVIAILTTIWHLLYIVSPVLSGVRFRMSHLLLMGTVGFLSSLTFKRSLRGRVSDAGSVLLLIGLYVAMVYTFVNFQEFPSRVGAPTQADIYISMLLIAVTLEGARRLYGKVFFFLGIFALAYALFGELIPGTLGHPGVSLPRLMAQVALPNLGGIFGLLLGISATIIMVFVYFGAFLQKMGGAEYFGDLAKRLTSGIQSGPVLTAIISSGFMGMVTGSAVANVASTGSFSIPLMKDMGYDRNFAAAVESVASTGGGVLPPIMGASAFIMASIIGRPYLDIIIAAAMPAVLLYVGLMAVAYMRSVKEGHSATLDASDISLTSLVIRSFFLVPVLIVILSLQQGNAALVAGWHGILSLTILYVIYQASSGDGQLIDRVIRLSKTLLYSLDHGTRRMAPLTIIVAEIAWIVAAFQATGFFNKLASILVYLAGQDLLLLLVTVAVLSIFFGFGMPTVPAYLLVAYIGPPALIQFGISDISAHLFVLYYATLSAISPPVAVACLVASEVADGEFFATAKNAMRFAFIGYILPFLWIYNPAILADASVTQMALTALSLFVGILLLVAVMENIFDGRYARYTRIGAGIIGIGCIFPHQTINVVSMVLGILVLARLVANIRVVPTLERTT